MILDKKHDKLLPFDWKNGFDMDETKLLGNAIAALEKKIINCRELPEKQALLFYRDELKKLRPCPEDEQFRRPGKSIGGSGDKMVFQKLVCRDEEDRPLVEKGRLKTITCAFDNIETYVDFVLNKQTPQRKSMAFYNGMSMDEYLHVQTMNNAFRHRFY